MIRAKLYNKTVMTLLCAYEQGELRLSECPTCAVGTLCGGRSIWAFLFMTCDGTQLVHNMPSIPFAELRPYKSLDGIGFETERLRGDATELVKSTGYTIDELARIEFAFEEDAPDLFDIDIVEYKEALKHGLGRVLKVLKGIHKVSDDEHAKLITTLNGIYSPVEP